MTLYNNVTVQPLVKPCVTVSVEKSQKRFNIVHSWERCLQTGKEGLDAFDGDDDDDGDDGVQRI